MGIARNLASPAGSDLPPGSVSPGFNPGLEDAAVAATERDDATRSLPASFGSALDDPAPATTAALTLGDALESWSVAFTPAAADVSASTSNPPAANAGADLSPDTAAAIPEGADAPADASEGLALALWQDGRRDEAIQVLEQGIAMEKHSLPAALPPERPADAVAESTGLAVVVSPAEPRRRFRPAAAIGLLAGAALLLAGAALWNGRDAPAGKLAEAPPEIAGDAQGVGEQAIAPITPRAGKPIPAVEVPKPLPAAMKPAVAEPAPLRQPARAESTAPARPAAANKPVPELRRSTPALPVKEAAAPRDVRVPKGRPALPAAEASAPPEPAPAARQAEPQRPPASRAPRPRLAERRAAAERYAARRRAAAERASGRSAGPSVLLGGRGLP